MIKRLNIVASLGLEIPALEADQEGQLRGGFSTFGGMMIAAVDGNGNCNCNCGDCGQDNGNCNCNCGTCSGTTVEPTSTATSPSTPAPTGSPMSAGFSVGLSFLF